MQLIASQSRLRRARRLRGGIVIGLALALVGVAVGTTTGAVTPFQLVLVKNTAAEPIPVVGTVNVGNTPANQSVTVSNFPATQPVTLAAVAPQQVVNKNFNGRYVLGAGEHTVIDFGKTINVTTLIVANGSDDYFSIDVLQPAPATGFVLVRNKKNDFREEFSMPVPANGVQLECDNLVLTCVVFLAVVGY